MRRFTVRTADQLPALLQAFRKHALLTQAEVALRLGVTQQTYSALERNADRVGAARLLKLLAILGVELVIEARDVPSDSSAAPLGPLPSKRRRTGQPDW